MQAEQLKRLLEQVREGHIPIEEAFERIVSLPLQPIEDYANLDHHRALRTGIPEVILAQGKTPGQVAEIFVQMAKKSDQVLATRLSAEMYAQIRERLPKEAVYLQLARALYLDKNPQRKKRKGILVLTAGSADIPVAEEAAITAELMGNQVERIYDVGVAGLHRLLYHLAALQKARVLIVVAGMEGALPSVVGGLVRAPVIAVPTSVGYGASFNGLAALLAMLNSCASGVAVVNIDNGFGAGCLAAKINCLGNAAR